VCGLETFPEDQRSQELLLVQRQGDLRNQPQQQDHAGEATEGWTPGQHWGAQHPLGAADLQVQQEGDPAGHAHQEGEEGPQAASHTQCPQCQPPLTPPAVRRGLRQVGAGRVQTDLSGWARQEEASGPFVSGPARGWKAGQVDWRNKRTQERVQESVQPAAEQTKLEHESAGLRGVQTESVARKIAGAEEERAEDSPSTDGVAQGHQQDEDRRHDQQKLQQNPSGE